MNLYMSGLATPMILANPLIHQVSAPPCACTYIRTFLQTLQKLSKIFRHYYRKPAENLLISDYCLFLRHESRNKEQSIAN